MTKIDEQPSSSTERVHSEAEAKNEIFEKLKNHRVSSSKFCRLQILIDRQQKEALFGLATSEERKSMKTAATQFDLKISFVFRKSSKFCYKLFGVESKVRGFLIDAIGKICKSKSEEKSEKITTLFVTTINPDASITEQEKSIPKQDENQQNSTEFGMNFLLSKKEKQILEKNWNFLVEFIEEKQNVTLAQLNRSENVGEKESVHAVSISSFSAESIADAALQIYDFLSDQLALAKQVENKNTNDTNSRPVLNGNNQSDRTVSNRNRKEIVQEKFLLKKDCIGRIVGMAGSNIKFIKNKSHLRDFTISRKTNEDGYNECSISAYQSRNIQSALEIIRSFLRKEDSTVLLLIEKDQLTKLAENPADDSSNSTLAQSALNFVSMNKESAFTTKSFQLDSIKNYPQPSYNFQNPPSFDFTHQATSAARKTDKRPGDLVESSPCLQTPNEFEDHRYGHSSSSGSSSISPRHRSKRACPETKEIHCTTDDGFWIQKQYYHALDDSSKQILDDILEKLEKIRIANEENAAKKHQRIAGRNRSAKQRLYPSVVGGSNEENYFPLKIAEKEIEILEKENSSTNIFFQHETKADHNEEKENHQDLPTILTEHN